VLQVRECLCLGRIGNESFEADAAGVLGTGSTGKGAKMKKVMIVPAVLFVFPISAFAEMSTGQGGGMMGGGWGWGMNSGWFFMIIIAILVIFGIASMMKRK